MEAFLALRTKRKNALVLSERILRTLKRRRAEALLPLFPLLNVLGRERRRLHRSLWLGDFLLGSTRVEGDRARLRGDEAFQVVG